MQRIVRLATVVLFLPLVSATVCWAQPPKPVLGGLNRLQKAGAQSEEVQSLYELFRSDAVEESDLAARRLIELSGELIESKKQVEAVNIASDLFLSSAPNDVRQKAFGILDKNASTYLAPHVREIKVLVPNVSCYGRFVDWLKRSVRDEYDWVYKVGIRNTYRVKEQPGKLTLGTVAELTFTIDTGKKPSELAKALKTSQLDGIQGWTMMVEQPIDALAE